MLLSKEQVNVLRRLMDAARTGYVIVEEHDDPESNDVDPIRVEIGGLPLDGRVEHIIDSYGTITGSGVVY